MCFVINDAFCQSVTSSGGASAPKYASDLWWNVLGGTSRWCHILYLKCMAAILEVALPGSDRRVLMFTVQYVQYSLSFTQINDNFHYVRLPSLSFTSSFGGKHLVKLKSNWGHYNWLDGGLNKGLTCVNLPHLVIQGVKYSQWVRCVHWTPQHHGS